MTNTTTTTKPAAYTPATVLRMLEKTESGTAWDRITAYQLEAALLCALLDVATVAHVLARTVSDCLAFTTQNPGHRALLERAASQVAELALEGRPAAEYTAICESLSVLLSDTGQDRLPAIGNAIAFLLEGLGTPLESDGGSYASSDLVITVVGEISDVEDEQRQVVAALRERIAALEPADVTRAA